VGESEETGKGSRPLAEMATPFGARDYADNRAPGEWQSRYPPEARRYIHREAIILAVALIVFLILGGIALCFAEHPIKMPFLGSGSSVVIEPRLLAMFFSGCVGGTTFSIKWLIHAVARGMWHLDRVHWRLFVPVIGGVYACAMLTLIDIGIIGGQAAQTPRSAASTAGLGFLIGYFSDGVSGLLTNMAKAVFGTVQEK
jgi:hypothetical protein